MISGCHTSATSFATLVGVLYVNFCRSCLGAPSQSHPIVKRFRRPHHAMFSADPSPCPCTPNLQPQVSDDELARLRRSNVALPGGPIIAGVDEGGDTKYYPWDFGNSCKAWDKTIDAECDQKFPPARCSQRWCFVNPDCAKPDTHRVDFFPGSERYISYEACGSFDAQQAYVCHTHYSEKTCLKSSRDSTYTAGSRRCEWSRDVDDKALRRSKQVCQPEGCRCTGQHLGEKLPAGSYGSQCGAWDRQKCEEWQNAPNAKMGIWCCQSWCYVDATCPSASPSSTPGLYWSYAACAEKAELIDTCPWKEPIGWQGSPATLSDGARRILIDGKKPSARKMEQEQKPALSMDSLFDNFSIIIAGSGFLFLLVCLVCCICCRNNFSSDENARPEVSLEPPAPSAAPGPGAGSRQSSNSRPKPKPRGRANPF